MAGQRMAVFKKYDLTEEDQAYLNRAFMYHAPQPDQVPRYNELRTLGGQVAQVMMEVCPPSRERSLALSNLEEAIMWANVAIARSEE